jgi:hypothetical protein
MIFQLISNTGSRKINNSACNAHQSFIVSLFCIRSQLVARSSWLAARSREEQHHQPNKTACMRKRNFICVLLLIALCYTACTPRGGSDNGIPEEVTGMAPVYTQDNTAMKLISGTAPRSIVNGGKMYTTGNLLFQVEQDSGIHVINYANPQNPQKIAFIRSFLCREVSVKNGFIYTNNFDDLVVVDISNLNNIHEVSRVADVFPDLALQYPPKPANSPARLYFECPDPAKGTVVRWESKTIHHPKCWR